MSRQGWLCRCGYRNEPAHVKCRGAGCGRRRPRRRVPTHARTLQELSFEEWAALSQRVHGGELYSCALCGRPPTEGRRHDRDHDHRTGRPRGLLCWKCNRELVRHITLEEARAVVAYFERAETVDTDRLSRQDCQPMTAPRGEAATPTEGTGA